MTRLLLHKGRQQSTAPVFYPIQGSVAYLHLSKSAHSNSTKVAFPLDLNRGVSILTYWIVNKKLFEMQPDMSKSQNHLQPLDHLIASTRFVVVDHQLMCRLRRRCDHYLQAIVVLLFFHLASSRA